MGERWLDEITSLASHIYYNNENIDKLIDISDEIIDQVNLTEIRKT